MAGGSWRKLPLVAILCEDRLKFLIAWVLLTIVAHVLASPLLCMCVVLQSHFCPLMLEEGYPCEVAWNGRTPLMYRAALCLCTGVRIRPISLLMTPVLPMMMPVGWISHTSVTCQGVWGCAPLLPIKSWTKSVQPITCSAHVKVVLCGGRVTLSRARIHSSNLCGITFLVVWLGGYRESAPTSHGWDAEIVTHGKCGAEMTAKEIKVGWRGDAIGC